MLCHNAGQSLCCYERGITRVSFTRINISIGLKKKIYKSQSDTERKEEKENVHILVLAWDDWGLEQAKARNVFWFSHRMI